MASSAPAKLVLINSTSCMPTTPCISGWAQRPMVDGLWAMLMRKPFTTSLTILLEVLLLKLIPLKAYISLFDLYAGKHSMEVVSRQRSQLLKGRSLLVIISMLAHTLYDNP